MAPDVLIGAISVNIDGKATPVLFFNGLLATEPGAFRRERLTCTLCPKGLNSPGLNFVYAT